MEQEIYYCNLSALENRIEELNKRAEKMGLQPITITVGTPYQAKENGDEYTKVMVTVEGESPKYNGWQLVGVAVHDGEITVLNSVPGYTIPNEYRNADGFDCDHCQRAIPRKETYVIQHEDGKYMRVGSTCLKDFLGHTSVSAMLAYANWLRDLEEEIDAFGYYSSSSEQFSIKTYLAYVALEIRECGWVSRSKAQESDMPSTVSMVWKRIDEAKKRLGSPTTEADYELGEAALEWAATLDPTNDYLYNLNQIATNAIDNYFNFNIRFVGYVASMIPAYKRALEKQAQREFEAANKTHVGTVGKRQEFTLKLVGESQVESYYGLTSIYRFNDADGNNIVWFSSSNHSLEVGETYSGKATVKEHGEYNGVPQTKITRFSIKQ